MYEFGQYSSNIILITVKNPQRAIVDAILSGGWVESSIFPSAAMVKKRGDYHGRRVGTIPKYWFLRKKEKGLW